MGTGISFLGLGNMGNPMAHNLLKSGNKLFIYNRTKEKGAELIQEGAQWLNSPKEAFLHASIAFSIVSNDQALLAITEGNEGLLQNAKPGCIHISMSTISPELSRELAKKHSEKGVHYIASPVFGRPEAAVQQSLSICFAGKGEIRQQIEPLLHVLGKKIYDFGEDPGIANTVKLIGNFLLLSNIELMSEAFAFAKKSGISLDKIHTFLAETLFPFPIFQNYGRLIIDQNFTPGLKMTLGLKDINLFLHEANALNVPLPIANLLHERLLAGLANHREELDWSAISIIAMEEAGITS
jgi:3-hydroxyisobutyrate dehydrogenase-like beta-hydroxyacid dehydrogenase